MLRAAGRRGSWVGVGCIAVLLVAAPVAGGCYWDFSEAQRDGGGPAGDGADGDGSGAADASAPDAAGPLYDPIPFGPFDTLSESGLYLDMAGKTVREDILEFRPEFALWTDRAAKTRWIWLPHGEQIRTINMGAWVAPVGTTAWKEFRDPDTGKRLETRIVQRLPDDACGAGRCFYYATFLWNEDDSEATFDPTRADEPAVSIPAGCAECASPPCSPFPDDCHIVPQATSAAGTNGGECRRCHDGEGSRLLGFSAVQLSHAGPGLTLEALVAADRLSDPPPAGVTYPVPGTPVERAAIGYLHANCGHCHFSTANQQNCHGLTQFATRVRPGDEAVTDTLVWQTGVGQDLAYWVGPMEGNHTGSISKRIVPGDAQSSAVWYRMSVREWGKAAPLDDHQQMPTLGTSEVDPTGLGQVETWIELLQ